MKKIVGLLCAAVLSTAMFAQVLGKTGVQNTLSTGFKRGPAQPDADHSGMVKFSGFDETFQVRFDINKFTVESMLSWGLFEPANNDDVSFNYKDSYVNFLLHPVKGLDVGAGTNLNWVVGKAPSVVQTGFNDMTGPWTKTVPEGDRVVGKVAFANKYGDRALGARYAYNDLFEVGLTLPDNTATNNFCFNAAFQINPLDFLSASIAYNGIGRSYGDLYVGSSLYFNNLSFDIFLAGNFRPKSSGTLDGKATDNISNDLFGWGVGATISIPQINMTIKPELAFTDLMNPNYTFAWSIGTQVDFTLADVFNFGLMFSYDGGAKDKRWAGGNLTNNGKESWDGGCVVKVRPDVSWNINKHHKVGLAYEFDYRQTPSNKKTNWWDLSINWVYKY